VEETIKVKEEIEVPKEVREVLIEETEEIEAALEEEEGTAIDHTSKVEIETDRPKRQQNKSLLKSKKL